MHNEILLLLQPSDDKPALARLPANDCSDEAMPKDFHPPAHKTKQELCSQRVVEQLSPRDPEARTYVQKVLADWKDMDVLSKIENHALSVPASSTDSVSGLADSLAGSNAHYLKSMREDGLQQQLAKAYAIFFWVTTNISYDTELLHQFLTSSDGKVDCRAEQVLRRRRAICTGYTNLYQALAEAAQLEVAVVHGNMKTWRIFAKEGPIDGVFQPQRSNSHSWNMVIRNLYVNYKFKFYNV